MNCTIKKYWFILYSWLYAPKHQHEIQIARALMHVFGFIVNDLLVLCVFLSLLYSIYLSYIKDFFSHYITHLLRNNILCCKHYSYWLVAYCWLFKIIQMRTSYKNEQRWMRKPLKGVQGYVWVGCCVLDGLLIHMWLINRVWGAWLVNMLPAIL